MRRRLFFILIFALVMVGFSPRQNTQASTITQPVTLYVHGHHGNIRSIGH